MRPPCALVSWFPCIPKLLFVSPFSIEWRRGSRRGCRSSLERSPSPGATGCVFRAGAGTAPGTRTLVRRKARSALRPQILLIPWAHWTVLRTNVRAPIPSRGTRSLDEPGRRSPARQSFNTQFRAEQGLGVPRRFKASTHVHFLEVRPLQEPERRSPARRNPKSRTAGSETGAPWRSFRFMVSIHVPISGRVPSTRTRRGRGPG